MKRIDLTGQRFGRLVAKEYVGKSENGCSLWKCMCDCGEEITARTANLRNGNTQSCGCYQRQRARETRLKHDLTNTRLFKVFQSMVERTTNPKAGQYENYGGRGITICDEWLNDFQAFYDWAMANGYDPDAPRGECSIDRIDNDKGYSPDNCRWVDQIAQANNRRTNRFIVYLGEKITITQAARKYGLRAEKLRRRIIKGWSVEAAIETP